MTTLSTIKDWIELVTGYGNENVVRAYGNGPEPIGDYATFGDPIADEELVVPFVTEETSDAGDLTTTYYVQTRVTVPISIYARDGGAMLRNLALSVKAHIPRATLTGGGLAFESKGPIFNLTEFNDTGADPRFQADFDFISYDEYVEQDYEVFTSTFSGRLKPNSGDDIVDDYDLDFT